jgi:amidohydrolase
MDALSITEETGLDFASQNPGVMHACGHDGHTAMLLVAAKILSETKDQWSGTIKFFFQSAEECAPHGGAKYMIEAGVLLSPEPAMVFGLHLWPDVPLGQVGVKEGPLMSASDRLRVHVTGKGGHGAMPHQAVDAVFVASSIVTALQSVVSRQVDPMDAAVVTIGELKAGSRYNVIAEEASLDGTVRTQNEVLRDTMPGESPPWLSIPRWHTALSPAWSMRRAILRCIMTQGR